MDPGSYQSIVSGPLPTVDERAELTGQYTMASPEVKTKRKEEEVDVSYLSVKKQSKIERCTNKSTPHQGPTKLIVILKWATTLIFAAVLLASLVVSKFTLFGLVQGLKIEKEVTNGNYQTFFMCIITLVAPNVISLLRSVWNIIGRSDVPWPNKRAIALIALTAALESTGLCIVIFKTLASGSPASGISAMQIGFVLPILFHIKKGNRDILLFRTFSLISMVLAFAGVGLVIYIYIEMSNEDAWSLVGVILVFLSMFPYLSKKIYSLTRTPVSTLDKPIPTGSINRSNSSGHFSQGPSSGSDYNSLNSMSSGISIASTNTEPDPINNVTSDNAVVWKTLLISSLFKIMSVFAISALLIQYGMGNMSSIDAWNFHWEWKTDGLFWSFIVHITASALAYVTAVFACHTCMDRGAFVIPLLLSSPVSCVLLAVSISCNYIRNALDGSSDYCGSYIGLSVGAMAITTLSICLVYGRLFWSVKRLVLLKETQLFWLPTYNSVMLEQWMYLNRKLSQETEDDDETLTRADEKTRVYICTTMYRESRKEMQQLVESIGKISQATSDKAKIHFESHIFLDGAVRGDEMNEFALQLISLLKDVLHIDDILTCTKTATPYGLRLGWKLPGPCGMTFTIHMKDPKKVKKKKRWSQIMYMSYVLDFLSKQHVDRDGNPIVKDSDCFILTTDADVKFTPESVEALLDLMKRDTSVGAVCARTYPLGEGPLVWYQKFEYAIGHWFQKAAEHVLGSVLCAPGCFSVYRCSALKDIIPTYASSVERAFEFLIKDMGEDRWLCTLMVQSGWRIEYCAASENETYCPEEFEEFYKQRRRWIASTLANIISLIKEWNLIRTLNHRVSYLFCIYQIFLLTSTFIGPSTVIIIVAGGLNYAWDINVVWAVVLQILVCIIYAGICLFMNETWQMQSGKIITFLYAVVMTAVVVGIAEQVAEDLIAFSPNIKTEVKSNVTVTIPPDYPTGAISEDFPVSFVTLYLGLLIAVFLFTGLLHPSEFSCLLNGITYLLCLPSGYLVLNIYSVVNITDRSWGTREEKEHNSVKQTKPWYDGLETVMRKIFFCFDKKETQENPSIVDMQDEKSKRKRKDSDKDSSQSQNLSKSLGPGFKFGGKSLSRSQSVEQKMEQVDEEEDLDVEVESDSDEEAELYDELDPTPVEEWLPKDMKEYAKLFKDNGYENTNFLSMLTEIDLKRLGIKKVAERRNLCRKIQNIPEFTIPVDVPKDLSSWLHQIGLNEYKPNFRKNQIKTIRDMEALKSFSIKEINEDLNITKLGHVRRLQDAIERLRKPTHEERVITEFKEEISQAFLHDLKSVNQEENKFWKDLIRACLEPASDAFGFEEILKGKLQNLRNEWLMVSGIVNCLWIVIIMTLSSSIDLQIAGTNPLSLLFLIVFGFLFVLQFSCMLVHRFTTLSHFIARAPYKFGQNYRSSVSFLSRDIDSEEELLTREVRNLEPQFLRRIRSQQKQGKRKKSISKSSETAPLIANHHGNDIYTGPPVKEAYEENMLAERGQYVRKV